MNMHTSAHVALSEPDVEGTVLGSILAYPDVMPTLGATLKVEWFTDTAARAFAEAILEIHRKGHKIAAATVIAAVSPAVEVDGLTRAQFVGRCMTLALPAVMLSGPIEVLKDRWARRLLASEAERLAKDAVAIDVDPLNAATAALGALDVVTASHGEQATGSLADSADALFDEIATIGERRLVTTGLKALDAAFKGYPPGMLYVVAARPGMGKSAFMAASARKTAMAGHGVAVFSLEMSRSEISARCIADSLAAVRAPSYGDIMDGQFSAEDMDAIGAVREAFNGLPLHIDASARLTMLEIAARCRAVKARFAARGVPLSVVFVDHMGLVTPSDRYAGNKTAETGEVSRAGKILAKQLGCCVVLLCQLSREVEKRDDKRPNLSDLRWSGDIEQDADVVAFLFREHYYLAADPAANPGQLADTKNRLDVLIRKNRNGAATDVPLWCSMPHSAIRDNGRNWHG